MRQIAQLEKSYMKEKLTDFKAGDTVKVHVKIREGDKERIQIFQGTVIGRRGGGTNQTFTVRKISGGIGVERVFPIHSPNVSKIERIRMGKVRRARLNYLRSLTGKSARIEEQLDDKGKAGKKSKAAKAEKKKVTKADAPKAKKVEKTEAKPTEPKVEKTKTKEKE